MSNSDLRSKGKFAILERNGYYMVSSTDQFAFHCELNKWYERQRSINEAQANNNKMLNEAVGSELEENADELDELAIQKLLKVYDTRDLLSLIRSVQCTSI